ncbi:MAG: hypothetical protein R3C45_14505 [Phycisphaerales bacterium]
MDENYPQIVRVGFFDINPAAVLLNVPQDARRGFGRGQMREVTVPPLDAVVGNPPCVRQEGIPKSPKTNNGPKPGTGNTKQVAGGTGRGRCPGRSDLHVYFWLHAADFLNDGGWLGFLTSSQWLDVDYGFRLQEYILRRFEVHAVFESLDEPWFVGARVATCATLLRRQRDESAWMNHLDPVRSASPPDLGGARPRRDDRRDRGASTASRDLVCKAKKDVTTPQYRPQHRPAATCGTTARLGGVPGKTKTRPAKDPAPGRRILAGGKWGTLALPDSGRN